MSDSLKEVTGFTLIIQCTEEVLLDVVCDSLEVSPNDKHEIVLDEVIKRGIRDNTVDK